MEHMEEEQLEISTGYAVHLEGIKNIGHFDGPLDLLLHLIKQAKIEITDIFLSDVTEQFLHYIDQLDQIDMDSASEFLEVAATLLEIKSKALLPIPEEENVDEEDAGRDLIRRLEEYKLYKEASEELKKQEVLGAFAKDPDMSAFKPQFVLKDMNLDGLLNAFSKLLTRMEKKAVEINNPKEIKKDVFTVAEKIQYIKDAVVEKQQTSFFSLFNEAYTKIEVITTFQALLELLKLQIVYAVQSDVFEDIIICLKEGAMEIINQPIEIEE